jgi:signal transduction histidine kinase
MKVRPASLRPWRNSIRARIVIACAALFLVPGAILIAAAYTQIGRVLEIHSGGGEVTWRNGKVTYFNDTNNPQIAATVDASKRRGFLDFTLAGLGLGTALAAGLGWAVSRRVLRPLTAVTVAAQDASQDNLDHRLALAGPPDELKELADTFDAMLARLEAAFASQRRFVANASHELRTPLTEMRTLIDVTAARPAASPAQLKPVLAAIGTAVDKSEELIEALLTLARSDGGPGSVELVDLPTAVEDAIDSIGPAAAARQIQIGTALHDAQVTGDRVLLERLVSNLIDNAVKHNVTGGWVLASTRTEEGIAEVTVANGGENIPPGQVTGLFEPFRRLAGRTGARPGAGLGLSIVASVANAHGGHAQARARPDGGLDVRITLPATPSGPRPAPQQPQTTTPQTWQPDHRIPPAAGQGRPVADGSGLS